MNNSSIELLIINLKESVDMITEWLKDSGLSVNDVKNKICLFSTNYQGSLFA